MFTNTGRHVRFAVQQYPSFSPVWPRPRLTPPRNPSSQEILQDEAKKKIAKDEIVTDVNDLAERSGRADMVSSSVTI